MNDDYDTVKPAIPINIGTVVEVATSETNAIMTRFRRHTDGFSLTHYRRTFMHNGQREIPGTSKWLPIRHQEWRSEKTFDWLHESQREFTPTEPIPGDIDD